MPVGLAGTDRVTAPRVGLVDTGAENVLAASWLADLAGVDAAASTDVALIGIGGETAEVHFAEVELRLYGPDAGEDNVSFRCDVGFVPGWQESPVRPSKMLRRCDLHEEDRRSQVSQGARRPGERPLSRVFGVRSLLLPCD
ncbi:MAG: hypothetical protein ACRDZW_07195 [Acidimicrobiales bacterium]